MGTICSGNPLSRGVEFASLTRPGLECGSLFAVLKHDYGIEHSYADEEVDGAAAK